MNVKLMSISEGSVNMERSFLVHTDLHRFLFFNLCSQMPFLFAFGEDFRGYHKTIGPI